MTNDDIGRPATIAEPVRRLIDGANYAHLATLLPNGGQHSVPMWVGMENGRIAVMTSLNSRKARNLERDPRVALSITDHDRPLVMATLRGRVTERVDGDRGWTIIDRLSQKYIGQPYPLRTDRVIYLIQPEYAHAATYG